MYTLAFLCLFMGATSVSAEVVELQNVKIEVPTGWTTMPSASTRSIRLRGPGGKVEITVVVHNHGASSDGDIEQLAKRFLEAETQAFARTARESGLSVSHQTANVGKEASRWQLKSSRGLSNGMELRGITTFEAGRAISIGAESKSAGQSELDIAVRLVASQIGT
ncbi:hypothetical protein [Delftia acidovorans]|uniref:hypothetical protein n=1 Tax=Delftia acidovorans TaxID=80866 RepID=UPI0012D30DA1|nr:hypothetical protein [Delftia acidovorans]QQB48162.1 hypothetical protein I6H54_17350 [Delftia acidovorans]